MKKLGMMVLILLGAVTLLGQNYALAKGPHGDMGGKAHFDAMDTNKDGKISQDEHMAKCKNRFKAKDTNNDGFLTRDECRKGCDKHKEIMKEKMQKGHSHEQPTTSPAQVSPEESKSTSD
jgi:hypothetical protein